MRSEPTHAGLLRILTLCAALVAWMSPAAAQQGPRLRREIAETLVVADADRMRPFRWTREPAVIALYFGADWCGPCHAFVPDLVRIRAALREAGADTEVVYVSQDHSETQMRRYMRQQQMPWPAIDYRRIDALPALRRLAGTAPPNLVLLDRAGNVLASGWEGRHYIGLTPVLRTWSEHLRRAAVDTTPPLLHDGPAAHRHPGD
ncbi:thioredoxin-like domain-containing protein [Xanthomonas hortorum]|uniref:Alkyl hydroperoxide reductase n=1 Tax=Xanthomonas hortorum pv. pelargonii TaxID=453602 RepID=A0A6V7EWM9_9XANT|nr:thioredoxin-like domain-containing protein [Xanthomonas hortorum]MCE4355748.1 alkyl hydroperoxide reductase [Xanthomonas hortorum pv. pelargonii]MCM5523864.1 alkyl hydroperoxide reductase [Xanthomonas hortorum pv. pelargonii]MCM5536093.1 alkyl hydroperoxide reductase [Xanthomonas hortorum pv. pelargonii]MCM5540352.1 alkyl hydroperoxide reductase [Xanthomonas hortorum pv. pelargonii]MCM5543781.1 alkyl hydroperoxide reductase [Xanthomonas hortorum pv. pelargonii]